MSELEDFYAVIGTEAAAGRLRGRLEEAAGSAVSPDDASHARGPVSAWAVSGDQYWGITHSIDRIAPGCYTAGASSSLGVYLERQPVRRSWGQLILHDRNQQHNYQYQEIEGAVFTPHGIVEVSAAVYEKGSEYFSLRCMRGDRCFSFYSERIPTFTVRGLTIQAGKFAKRVAHSKGVW